MRRRQPKSQPRAASPVLASTVLYRRFARVGTYSRGAKALGHDLEIWTYEQEERLPVPALVPRDAEYHCGHSRYLAGGQRVQSWDYVRRASRSPEIGVALSKVTP